MTLPKPTRPAPPMPAIKPPAVDYRALLVRYMASVVWAEGVSFIQDDGCAGEQVTFSASEVHILRQLEIEACALLDDDFREVTPAAIAPRFRVFLHGIEQKGVLEFGQEADGRKYAEFYADSDGQALATRRVYADYEFREVPPCE